MKRTSLIFESIFCFSLILFLSGCGEKTQAKTDGNDTGPHATVVEPDLNADNFKVDRPERFPVVAAGEYMATPELNVTGVVSADTTRQVPVPSLTAGRVLEVDAKVGDVVTKGQVLFKVRSSDIAGALSDYHKALRNEQSAVENLQLAEDSESLATAQLNRSQLLYEKGATPKSDLEIKLNAEKAAKTAVANAKVNLDNTRVDVTTTTERLHLLEADPDHSNGIVNVVAPSSGVVTDQQITAGAGVQALTPPMPFTITDLSRVWVQCDVYENDIAKVHVGEYAEIRPNAYPDKVLKARISNVSPVLDPNLRTAKVRLELENPGFLRLGMFVSATFHGQEAKLRATVPTTAILHLHDRQWVYTPVENGYFRRIEVTAGNTLPGNTQEIVSGLKPGEMVVGNALVLQDTVEK
jgi:cobalt-zinc-cadmium efflux system membrane fusion protein